MKNKFDKATDSKVNRSLLIFFLAIICIIVMSLKGNSQGIAYLICVDDGSLRETSSTHVTSLDNVAKYYKECVCQELDTTKVFRDGEVYFQYRTENVIFYCEKKKVVFKKNGKIAFRAIKRKEKSYDTY